MGQWNPAEGNPAVGRALGAVRAVTVLSGLKVVLTLDQLAAYVGQPISVLDTGMRNGPAAASQVERVVQGSYVGYRHPDAAWTGLPSRVAAAREGEEFARWFADWLAAAGPERRDAARGTAKAVAAAARAVGRAALADQIDGVYRRGRTRKASAGAAGATHAAGAAAGGVTRDGAAAAGSPGSGGDPDTADVPQKAVSRLPARTTAGILTGTAVLLVGAVAGVAVLTGTGPAQAVNRSRPPISASGAGAGGSVPAPSGPAVSAPAVSASASLTQASKSPRPGGASSGAATPVLAGFEKSPAGAGGSGTSAGSSGGGGGGSGGGSTGSSSSAAAPSSPSSPAPSVATDTSSAAPQSSSPAASATEESCLNLVGLLGVCL